GRLGDKDPLSLFSGSLSWPPAMPAFLSIPPLASERWIIHGFSTAAMGSMGLTQAADPAGVTANRRRFAHSLHVRPEAITVAGAVRREYGSRAEDLRVGLGPGICGSCYEVGPEFADRFPPEFL